MMSYLHILVCGLTLLYVSALLLICLLLKEEFKQHVASVTNVYNRKYQGLRNHYTPYNHSAYINLYKHLNINITTIHNNNNSNDNKRMIPTKSSSSSSSSMPWQTGIWPKKSNNTLPYLSLRDVSRYANSILWNHHGSDWDDAKMSMINRKVKKRILHVINPFSTNDKHLEETQNMTMASIEVARAWVQYTMPSLQVDILTVEIDVSDTHSKASPLRPKTFMKYPSPIHYYQNGSVPQPQLKDILNAGLTTAISLNYDLIIYSNMDINLMPHFYAIVDKMSDCYETFFINRVEIPDRVIKNMTAINTTSVSIPNNNNNNEDIYSNTYININTMEQGYKYALLFNQLHPGYDCMITTPQSLAKIINNVGDVFVGHPPVGSVLAKAAAIVDSSCITARGLPATFHVGTRNGHWNDQEESLNDLNDLNGLLGIKSNAMRRKSQKPCRPYSMMKSRKRIDCFPEIYPDIPLRLKALLPEDSFVKVI